MMKFVRLLEGKSPAWMTTFRKLYSGLQKRVNKNYARRLFGNWVNMWFNVEKRWFTRPFHSGLKVSLTE